MEARDILFSLAAQQAASGKELLLLALGWATTPIDVLPSYGTLSDARREALVSLAAQQPVADLYQQYAQEGVGILTILDDCYPHWLMQSYLPPAVLFYRGDISLLERPAVSIVGSRQHSDYGYQVVDEIVKDLVPKGYVTVSGLAAGIDTLVHERTIAHGGATIAVIGTGFNRVYPIQNVFLQQQLENYHLVLTEYPIAVGPKRYHFPMRNRIIAGLTAGTFVVEAQQRSGSLITANVALQNNREVFAAPGNIFSKLSQGTNQLIQAGAKLVMSADDIHEELQQLQE